MYIPSYMLKMYNDQNGWLHHSSEILGDISKEDWILILISIIIYRYSSIIVPLLFSHNGIDM